MKTVKDLLKTLNDEDRQNLEDEVEEIFRLGPYKQEMEGFQEIYYKEEHK